VLRSKISSKLASLGKEPNHVHYLRPHPLFSYLTSQRRRGIRHLNITQPFYPSFMANYRWKPQKAPSQYIGQMHGVELYVTALCTTVTESSSVLDDLFQIDRPLVFGHTVPSGTARLPTWTSQCVSVNCPSSSGIMLFRRNLCLPIGCSNLRTY